MELPFKALGPRETSLHSRLNFDNLGSGRDTSLHGLEQIRINEYILGNYNVNII